MVNWKLWSPPVRLKRSVIHPKRILLVACCGFIVFFVLHQLNPQHHQGLSESDAVDSRDSPALVHHDILPDIYIKLHEIVELEARDVLPATRNTSSCGTYQVAAAMKRHALKDVTNNQLYFNTDNLSVTMVTQMSDERLDNLHLIMKHWTGPISVTVYIKMDNLKNFMNKFQQRSNVLLHLVPAKGPYYPVNYLRNVALDSVLTKFVFLNDIDFIPAPNSYETSMDYIQTLHKRTVMVIPAFEEIRQKTRLRYKFPFNKEGLVQLYNDKNVQPFHLTIFEPGQAPTDSRKWVAAEDQYKIKWSRWYEPYIMGYTDEMPRYNEQLVGRYENKALQITEVRALGLDFIVNPKVFLLHLWHPVIPLNKTIYNCSIGVSWPYTKHLEKKYNVTLM